VERIKLAMADEPVESKVAVQSKDLSRWRCTICGFIYDPIKGDPDYGIKPGRPFEELPEDWRCPVCNATKNDFEKIE